MSGTWFIRVPRRDAASSTVRFRTSESALHGPPRTRGGVHHALNESAASLRSVCHMLCIDTIYRPCTTIHASWVYVRAPERPRRHRAECACGEIPPAPTCCRARTHVRARCLPFAPASGNPASCWNLVSGAGPRTSNRRPPNGSSPAHHLEPTDARRAALHRPRTHNHSTPKRPWRLISLIRACPPCEK